MSRNFRQARRFVLAGAIAGMTLFGSAHDAQALGTVTFAGASQVAYAQTTWTVSFKTANNANAVLAAGDTVTAVFDSAFTGIPATPTIALTAGFASCTATGSTTGSTVTVTLAGASCGLAKNTTGKFTIAGIVNPINAVYAAANFTVNTSQETTPVADGASETISAPTKTISSITPNLGTTAGGTSVTISGTTLGSTTLVTFGGVAGTSLVNVNATTVTVTTPAGTAGAVDVILSSTTGGVRSAGGFTYATTPSAPTISAITPSSGSLSVAFTAGATGGSAITSYKYSTDGGSTFRTRAAGTTASPLVISTLSTDGSTALVNGTSYNIQIKAVNAIGDGTASSTTAATPATTPSAPTITTITPSDGTLSVAFTAGATGGSAITTYKYSTDGGSTFRTRAAGTTASPLVISTLSTDGTTALVNGTSYNIQIKAVNAIGDGTASSTTAATPATTPSAPTITAITPSNGTLSVAFTAGATGGSAITTYKYSTDGGSTFFTRAAGTTASPLVITTLSTDGSTALVNGTSYNVQIKAVNAIGDGTASSTTAATPATTPSAPTITTITPSNGSLSVAFTAGANGGAAITSYKYSTDGGSTFRTRAAGTTSSPLVISTLSTDGTTALVNGTSYNIQIKAVNTAGDGTASSTTAATPATVPDAPTSLSGTAGNAQVVLTWTAPGSNGGAAITDYLVEFNDGNSWATFTDAVTATTGATVTGLANGTSYTFRVSAINSIGTGATATSSAVTPRTTPSAPTITAITPSNGSLSVAFTAGADGGSALTSYKYSTDGGSTFRTRAAGTTTSPLVISTASVDGSTALVNGTSYDIQIKAVNAAGDGTATATTAATPATTPSAPTITAITPSNGSLSVAFTAGATGGSAITSYKYSTDGGSTFRTRAAGTTASPIVISTASVDGSTALVNGTSYDIQIKAVNAIGDGTATATTAATPATTPSAPTITTITPSNGSLSVAFTAGATGGSAITTYEYSTNGGTNFQTRASGTTASPLVITTSSVDGSTALVNGTSYNIQIRAVNAIGSGTATSTTAATPATTPSAPTITTITPSNGSLSVAFTAGATGGSAITTYEYSTNGGTNFQTRASGTTASPLVITTSSVDGSTALVNGTSYNIQIRAVNAIGSGTATSTTAATPATTPSAPTITAITPSDGSLSVAFTAGATGGSALTSYKYSTDGGSTFFTRAAGTTASPLVISTLSTNGSTALVNGTSYDIQIKAVNAIGDGTATATTAATPRTTPSAPTITAITPSDGTLSVAFTAGADGGSALTSYKYSTDGGTTFRTRAAGTTASPIVIAFASSDGTTALVNGTSYDIQIKAVNVAGDGTASSTTAATPRTTPSAPTITAITPSDGSLSVAFTAGADGGSAITSYKYSTDGGSTFRTRAAGTTASPIVIAFASSDGTTALVNGTPYNVQIKAVNAAGDGTASSTTAATPSTTPSAPTITAITPSSGSLSVAFTAGADGGSALTSYKYSTDGGTTFFTRAAGTTASPLVISTLSTNGSTALANGTSYDIQIKAVNAAGDGAASATTAATPRTTPSAPTITAITPSSGSLSVAFTAGADGGSALTSYKYSTDGGTTFRTRAAGTTASPIVIDFASSDGTTALANGTSYDVQILAVNVAGDGTASATTAATPRTTPSAPTITAITPSDGSLSVAFTAGANGGAAITSYKYSTDGGTTFRTRAAGTTASPLVISTLSTNGSTALANGTSYDVQILAVNVAGDGAASATTAATPRTTPSAPTITAITPSNGSLSVAFTAGFDGGSALTSYKYSTDGGTTFFTRAAGTTASPLVISTLSTNGSTALANGTSYDIQIKAVNVVGDGAASATTAATPRTTPSAPTITAITPSDGSLSVAFTAGFDGGSALTSYKYSTDGGTTFRTRAAGTTASPIVIAFASSDGTTALVNGTSYDIQIKAVNVVGDGAASSTTAATPSSVPSAPTITAITPSDGSLSVAFTAGANGGLAITSYKYSTDGGTTFRTRAAGTTASPIVIAFASSDGTTALVNGTSYNVQIKAVNVVGDGAASSTTAATPRTTPSAPTITAITPSDGSLSVAFTAGADGGSPLTSYKYSTDGGTTFFTRAAGTTASPLVISTLSTNGSTALANGTSYDIQIKAVNVAGDGVASSTTAATPRTTPSAPTITAITPSDGSLSVAFSAGFDGGSALTSYKYSTDGGTTFRTRAAGTTASPIVIAFASSDGTTALVNGTSYNVQIKAVNVVGDGTASSTTAATPRTTPSAPTITAITLGNGSLSVAFSAGFDGGSALTSYKYSTDGGTTFRTRAAGTTASPIVIAFASSDGTTALVNGTSYNVQIKAVNVAGDGVASSTTAATPRTTPSAPTITAITPSDGSLSVAFTAGADGGAAITSYKYSTDGGTTFFTRASGTTASPLVISTLSTNGSTALANGTSYDVQILAVNVAGDGAASATTAATPRTTPSAPTITAITPGNGSLSVAFTAGFDGGSALTSYKYSTDGGTTFRTRAAGTTASPLVIAFASSDGTTALVNGTSYDVQIKAVNVVGDGTASSTTAATPRTTPSAPTITAITPSDGSLSVAFTAGADGGSALTSYKYSTDGGTTFRTRAAGTTASPIVIAFESSDGTTALANGTSYNVQIKAVNAAGDGAASATTAATPRTTPSAPTITAITPGNASLSVAFTAGATGGSAITSYKYSTDGGTTYRTRASGTTASPLVITTASSDGTTALVNGTSYDIRIKAVNAAGDGAASTTTAATPVATPSAPTITAITPGNASLSVAFSAGADGGLAITSYKYSTDGGTTFRTRAAGTTASPIVVEFASSDGTTALVNGTSYDVQILAVNANGDGDPSSTTAATPRTTPSAPTITAITPSNGSLSVAFSAGFNGGSALTSYKYSTDGGTTFRTRAAGTTASPLVISTASSDGTTALVNGTSYNIQIKAVNVVGDGVASSTTAATPRTTPSAPTITAITPSNGSLSVAFTAGFDGGSALTSYRYSTDGGTTFRTRAAGTTASPIVIAFESSDGTTALANGTSYDIQIRAVNIAGDGAASSTTAATPRTTPSAPTITAITPSNGSLSVAFTAGFDGGSALTSYKYSTDGGTTFRTRATGTTASPIVIAFESSDGTTALVNGTSYDIQIKAVNVVGDGAASSTTAATPATTPSAPTITAITPSNATLSVAFTAGATGGSAITNYEYSTDGGTTFKSRATGTTASPIVITTVSSGSGTLVNGTSYDVQIRAINAIGNGAASSTTAATPATTPSAPTITAITPSNATLSVAFTAGATGGSAITNYEYSTDGGTTFKSRATGTTASPIVITTVSSGSGTLVNGTSYDIQIRAINAIGNGAASSTTAATPATTPSAPTITAITPSNATLSVAFTAGATGGSAITNYEYSTDGGTTFKSRATGTTASPIVLTTVSSGSGALVNGTSYDVQIRAINAIGNGAASSTTAATPRTTPSAPTITAITPSNGSLSVAFSAGADGGSAITSYKYSTDGGTTFRTRAAGTTASPIVIAFESSDGTTALANGTSYDVQIKAVNVAGDGAASSTTAATPRTTPSAPTITAITPSNGSLSVAFSAGFDGGSAITSYKYSTDGGTTFRTRAAGTTASPIVIAFESSDGTTALVNGSSYDVQIKAVNVVGDGLASSTTAATPRTTPSAPTITAITPSSGSLSVAFSAGADGGSAITSYKYSTDGGTTFRTRAAGTTASPLVIAFESSDGTTALANGTSYNVQIKAVNAAGDGTASSTTAATPRTTPGAPTSVSGTAGNAQVSLTWTAPASNGGSAITDYVVEFDDGSGFATFDDGVSATAAATVTGLANGTSHTFRVSAVNAAGTGAASVVSGAVIPRTTPSAPTITAITPSNGSLSVAFTAGFDGGSALTSYKYSTDGGTTFRTRAAGTTASPLVIAFESSDGTTALANGTSYNIQIKAVNVIGDGVASSTTAATPRTTPSAPTITAITPSDGALSVAFTAGFDGGSAITSYKYSTDGGTTFRTRAAGTTASPIVIAFASSDGTTALVNGTSYNIQIKAVNVAGDGAASSTTAATPVTVPSAPTITAITPSNGSLSVAFTAGANGGSAITSYKYSTDGGTTFRTRAAGTTASPLVIDFASSDGTTALANGTSYNVQIKAVNAVGDGAASSTTAATPRTTPSAPTITAITPGDGSLSVAFSAGFNGGSAITSYKYSTDGGTTFRTRAAGTTASPIVITTASSDGTTALVNGTSYNIQIKAVNVAGDGAASSTTAATPVAVPSAPTITAITPSSASLSVAFSAGFDGGSAITSYKYSTDGGTTFRTRAAGTTASPIVIAFESVDGTTALVNGTSYNVQILAVNANGDGAASATTAATPRTTPGAPTDVSGTTGNAQVSLTWTAPASTGGSPITDYVVEFNGGSGFATFADGTSATAAATVTGLTNGTSYTFRVSAVNAAGTGGASDVSAAVIPRTTPGPPTSVSGTSGNTEVLLTWTAPSNGGSAITDYVIQSSPDGSIWTTFADGTSTSTSATVTGLTNGQAYTFRVAASNIAGTGNFSSASSSVTPATVPSAPTITAITPSDGSLSVAFTAGANGGSAITSYKYSTDGGTTFRTRAAGTTASPLVIDFASSDGTTALANGTSYNVQIKAVNAVGDSAASSTTAATPRTTSSAPTITAITPSDGALSVAFTAGADGGSAITSYKYSTDGGTTFRTRAAGTTASPLVIAFASSDGTTALVNGTSYDIQIKAVNAAGDGAASSTTAATPRTTPSAPTITAITPSSGSLSVAFTAGADGGSAITSYKYSTDGGTTFRTRAAGTTASPLVIAFASSDGTTALVNGTSYNVQIKAVNAVGDGAASATTAATPAAVPSAPTITAITPTDGSLSVAFSAGATGGSAITNYEYSTDGGTTFKSRATGTTASPLVITTVSGSASALVNGTSYDVQIRAINSIGNGAASSSTAATPRTTPSAPTITAITPSDGALSVAFTAGADGGSAITSYKYSTDGGTTFRTRAAGTTASPLVIAFASSDGTTALVNGTSYNVQIKAVNVAGDGAASSTTAATPASTPSAPTITLITPSDGSLSVAFTAPASNGGSAITSYKYSTDGGTTFRTRAAGTTASPLVIAFASSDGTTALVNGTSYNVQIKAVNAAGDGTASSTTAATPSTVPGAPTNVVGTSGNTQVSLTWTAPNDGGNPITDYVVEINDGSGFATFADGTSTSTSATVTGLTNGTSYTFRVSATNSAGTSSVSTVSAAVIPATVPNAPTGLTGESGAARVALNWTAPAVTGGSAITDYIIEFNDGSGFATFADGISTATAMSVTGLTNGAPYTFRVSAVNSVGTGATSNVAGPVTPFDAPGAPTGVSGTPLNTSVALSWTAPTSNGGSAITNYVIESSTNGTTWIPFSHAPSVATSATVTGLTNGTAYTFRVSATNNIGTGATSAVSAAVTPRTIPGVPTSVSGTSENSQVSLTWTAPSNGGSPITDYVVEVSENGASFVTFADGTSATAAATVTGLTNGTSYTFRVSATNAAGTSAPSTVSASVTPLSTPGAPTGVSGTPGNGQVPLTWSAPASTGGTAITDYVVEFNSGGSWSTFADGVSTATNATVTGLTNGTAYTFRVSATNSVGTGAAGVSAAVTPRTVPSAPTGVSGTAGDTQVALTWTAPASDGGNAITDYVVESSTNGTDWTVFADGTSTTTSATVTGLTNDTAYTFRVSATNVAGTGASGVSAAVTPRAKPGAPTGVAGTGSDGQVALTWTAPASDGGSAIIDYVVESSTNGTDWTVFADGTSTATSATVTGLSNGTSYTFRVSATSSIGTGAPSAASAAVTPASVPGAPSGVSGTAGDARVFLSWTAPSNGGSAITDYVVEVSSGGSYSVFADGTSSATSATVTGLSNGTAYTFRVSATNGIGTGATSTASAAVTPAQPPAATASLSLSEGNDSLTGTVSVVTNGSIVSAIDYEVDGSGTWVSTGLTASGDFTISGLVNGTSYSVVLRVTSSGTGSPTVSAAATGTPAVPPTTTTTTTTIAPPDTTPVTTTTTTTTIAPPNAQPSTTTTTIAPPETIPPTTSTTIPQPEPATSTTVPATTTTTTTVPLFITPTVITANDGATIMQMDVPQSSGLPDASQTVVAVVVPPEANTENLVWNMMMSDRVQQTTIDEGYMTIEVTANMQSGESVTTMDAPIEIMLPAPPPDGVLAYSRDGITWTLIPQLLVPTLPEGQPDGYWIEPDGTITLITRHLTGFGIRKPQAPLELEVAKIDIVSGSVSRALATGGTSEDPIRYQTTSDESVCRVTDSGLIYGMSAGVCTVYATRGGGSIYLDTSSTTFSATVVSSITPIVPPVANLPLILQILALIALCVLLGFLGNRAWLTISDYRSNSTKL